MVERDAGVVTTRDAGRADTGVERPDAGDVPPDAGNDPPDGGISTGPDAGDPTACVPLPPTPITEVAENAGKVLGVVPFDDGYVIAWYRSEGRGMGTIVTTALDSTFSRAEPSHEVAPTVTTHGAIVPAGDGAMLLYADASSNAAVARITRSGAVVDQHTLTSTATRLLHLVRTADGFGVGYSVADGLQPRGAFLQRLDSSGDAVGPAVSLAPAGTWLRALVWAGSQYGALLEDVKALRLLRLDANGVPVQPATPVDFQSDLAAWMSLASDGKDFLVGATARSSIGLMRFLDAGGQPTSGVHQLGIFAPQAAFDGETYGLATFDWHETGTAVRFATVEPGGVPQVIGQELVLGTDAGVFFPTIVADGRGFVVAWIERPVRLAEFRLVMARVCP